MPITAQSIVKEVQRAMNDYAGARVPATDVVPMINQAQRMIQAVRPDSTSAVGTLLLTQGSRQTLPANAATLIAVLSNATSPERRITRVDMVLLDASEPTWRSRAPSGAISHYMYDSRTPRTFWVYPPAIEGAQVEFEASSYPVDVPPPAGASWTTVTGNISLADEFEQALIFLTLHIAYRSDLEGAMNLTLSDGYLQKASTLLGVQLSTSIAATAKS